MRDRIQPFPIPAQDSRINLKCLKGLDLALEEAAHCSESHDIFTFGFNVGFGKAFLVAGVEAGEACADDGADGVGSRDVEVGKVCRVGLVNVVVCVPKRIV